MEKLKKLLRRAKKVTKERKKIFEVIFNEAVKDEIIRLNTDVQLFEQGLDARGVSLESIGGEYAPFTVLMKKEQGLPFTRVTLYDTGEFYASFEVVVNDEGFSIKADTAKEGSDLRDRWGDRILGLSNESIKEIKPLFIEELKKAYLRQII